jgi:catechol 2,3-dioxygenase-like lactoylglutathione lyase family enzyme
MITGLDHIHYICGDVEAAVKYFKNVFEAKETSRGEIRGLPVVRVNVNGAIIALMGTAPGSSELVPGKGSRGLDHIGFTVKDLDKTVEDLKKRGVKIGVGISAAGPGVRYAFIDGPDGIRIELLERT